MNKTFLILSGISLIMFSCEKNDGKQLIVENKKTNTSIVSEDTNQISQKENLEYCYMSVLAKDSVFLSYKVANGNITGKLKYKNFEKDSNSGVITGKILGDTLKVNYKFASEGSISEREIYFLQNSGILLEGIGNYIESGSSKSVYESSKTINFAKGQRLNPADCRIIENKLK